MPICGNGFAKNIKDAINALYLIKKNKIITMLWIFKKNIFYSTLYVRHVFLQTTKSQSLSSSRIGDHRLRLNTINSSWPGVAAVDLLESNGRSAVQTQQPSPPLPLKPPPPRPL